MRIEKFLNELDKQIVQFIIETKETPLTATLREFHEWIFKKNDEENYE